MYQVNLCGVVQSLAARDCRDDTFREACDYCIDAPPIYAAGSTVLLIPDGEFKASIATQVHRE